MSDRSLPRPLLALLALFLSLCPSAHADERPIIDAVRLEGVRVSRRLALSDRVLLQAGEPLDEARIEEARLKLMATGLFERVEPRLERGAKRGRVVVVLACVERQTTSLDAIHLGNARPTNLWGGVELSDLDPTGLGFSLGGGVVGGKDQLAARLDSDLGLGPTRPLRVALHYLDGQEPFVGPQGQRLAGEPVDHIPVPYQRLGLTVGTRRPLSAFARLHLDLRAEYVKASLPEEAEERSSDGRYRPFDFALDDGAGSVVVLGVGLEYDRRDDPAIPTQGLHAALHTRVGHGAGPFVSALFGVEQYVRMPFGHVLRLDGKLGGLVGDAPFFERFFVGDLHPYLPPRALGLNFASRRGPNLLDLGMSEARYERVAARAGLEYRLPLGADPEHEPYRTELFFGAAALSLGSPDEPGAGGPSFGGFKAPPVDLALDFGLRIETEIGVMGLSVGNILLLLDP